MLVLVLPDSQRYFGLARKASERDDCHTYFGPNSARETMFHWEGKREARATTWNGVSDDGQEKTLCRLLLCAVTYRLSGRA